MFGLIVTMFVVLLISIDDVSNYTKCVSVGNQKCMTHPILTNVRPNEYNQQLCYHPFAVNLDRCVGSFNTLNNQSNKVCVPKKTRFKSKHLT